MMTPPIGGMAPDLNANPMQSMFVQAPQIPTEIAPRQGMFGGGGNMQMAMMAAISALMARKHPQVSQMMQGLMQHRMSQQQAAQEHQQNMQDQRGNFMFEQDYRQQHAQPEMGEFERALQASGVQPGTPQWTQAMKRRADNMLDPIVNTIQGPVLRSMVTQGMQLPTQPVGPLTPIDEGGAGSPAPRPFPY